MTSLNVVNFTMEGTLHITVLSNQLRVFSTNNNTNPNLYSAAIFIRAPRTSTLRHLNNTGNAVTTTVVSLYNKTGATLIGSNNTTTLTDLGQVLADEVYLINVEFKGNATITSPIFSLSFSFTDVATNYFPGGIELSPLLPIGIIPQIQLYGNVFFDLSGYAVTTGQQIPLCFADSALISGTFNVIMVGGAIGVFSAYTQAFVQYSSLIVIVTALSNTTLASGSVIQCTISNVGTAVVLPIAAVLNPGSFIPTATTQLAEPITMRSRKAIKPSEFIFPPTLAVDSPLRSISNAEIAREIISENKSESTTMEEEETVEVKKEEIIKPPYKQRRMY